jgi:isoamylase
MLLIVNSHHDLVEFTLPKSPGGSRWKRHIDTNAVDDPDIELPFESRYGVTGRSLLLFEMRP